MPQPLLLTCSGFRRECAMQRQLARDLEHHVEYARPQDRANEAMKKVISERTGIPIGLDAAVLCWYSRLCWP
ncbi:hypothetical protein [Arthrobacter cheniae]|nr:hypothetical protein [Arthrobacter cheniae]